MMHPKSIEYPVVMGWFSGSSQNKPVYDPGINVPCPYCGVKMSGDNVRTHNLMAENRVPSLSVFFRTHKTCNENATDDGKQALDNFVMSALDTMKPNQSLGKDRK